MLQFITQQNLLFYAITIVCIFGVVSQVVLRSLYGQLLKDTKRAGVPKGKFMKQLRQRYQSGCRMRNGTINTQAFIRRNLMEFRFGGLGLHGWRKAGMISLVVCMLFGAAGWYLTGGINGAVVSRDYLIAAGIAVIVSLLVYGIADIGYMRECLEIGLMDSLDNSFFLHASSGEESYFAAPDEPKQEERVKEEPALRLKKNLSKLKNGIRESAASSEVHKERNAEILKQMNPDEQERVIREVLKEFLT